MNKQDFLAALRKGLSGVPQDEREQCLAFYREMLEDRMEEGLSEEEAVRAIGDADEIVRQTIAEIPLAKIAKERMRPKRRLAAWEVVLLCLGSPVWLSLAVAAAAVVFAVFVSLWAVIVSLWATFGTFAVCALGSVPVCIGFAVGGHVASGVALLSAGMVAAGLSILLFFGCRGASAGILRWTKNHTLRMKNCLIKKEKTQ